METTLAVPADDHRSASKGICGILPNSPMLFRRWDVIIALLSLFVTVAYGAIHFASVGVSELTKDTFETFSFDARVLPISIQHRLLFSLIGLLLALSAGYLAKDYYHAKGVSGKLITTFGNLRLWIVFLGSLVISCSVFYHAFIDV